MFRRKNKKKAPAKPNLIPILDAVFIFIFFLLLSAQFLEIYEIETEVPRVAEVENQQVVENKKILNLIVEFSMKDITLKTGLDETHYRTIPGIDGKYDLNTLKETLKDLKRNYEEEDKVILRPTQEVAYSRVIQVIDKLTQERDERNQKIPLFPKIIFEDVL